MNRLSRTKEIIAYITENQEVKLSDIADYFEVSVMTIRRDLINLENQGFLTVHRGKAVLNAGTSLELSPSLKGSQMAKDKKRIAKEAVKYITEGSTIFLDCGTTLSELAFEVSEMKNVTVVTNSLLVVNTLCNFSNIKLLVLPGAFHEKSMGFLDVSTYVYLQNLHVDIAFLGAESVSSDLGFMVPDMNDGECKRQLCACCKKVVVLADSSKIGRESMYKYADFDGIDVFITDNKCKSEDLEKMKKKSALVLTV